VRYIGIGGIFTAGIMSIIKMFPIIVQALKEMFKVGKKLSTTATTRVERDISLPLVALMTVIISILIFLYFRFSVLKDAQSPWLISLVSLVLALGISFLFAAVSAWAVAMISITPISGMTITTLIVSSIILMQLGLKGPEGMIATLLIGSVVCTALSMTGSLVTQFKIGYWLGSTPKTIQWGNLFGSLFSAVTVTLCIYLFYHTYGYKITPEHPNPMAAPQASAMAAVIQSVMASGSAPWFLYFLGAVIAVIIELLGISALAFALGMYLPIELNSPLILGALVAHQLQKSSKDAVITKKRYDKGMLVASGLIAGGALAGVIDSIFKMLEDKFHTTIVPQFANTGSTGNWMALIMFLVLAGFLYWDSRR
jgi:putative OPT family oligopeptide transporter